MTSYTGPFASPTTRGFIISVKDNGQGPTAFASDTSSIPITLAAPPTDDCTVGFTPFMSPISSGDITVKPALP